MSSFRTEVEELQAAVARLLRTAPGEDERIKAALDVAELALLHASDVAHAPPVARFHAALAELESDATPGRALLWMVGCPESSDWDNFFAHFVRGSVPDEDAFKAAYHAGLDTLNKEKRGRKATDPRKLAFVRRATAFLWALHEHAPTAVRFERPISDFKSPGTLGDHLDLAIKNARR